jgi:hypothetical protein
MNRFFDIEGDLSTQLAPWELVNMGKPIKTALFRLETPVRFQSSIAGGVIVVPKGYISDLASIPQFAWSIFMASDDPRIELGAWVHDLLYQSRGKITLEDGSAVSLTRKDADSILANEAMVDLLATGAQKFAVYQALRRFGQGWDGDSFWHSLRHRRFRRCKIHPGVAQIQGCGCDWNGSWPRLGRQLEIDSGRAALRTSASVGM